jgi:diguanylate cyclase (GGDEF)-like protein
MNKLVDLVAGHVLETLLNQIHGMVAAVEADGTLVSWNRAFEECKPALSPADKLQDFFLEADRPFVQSRLASADRNRWSTRFITGVDGATVQCDCVLVALPENRFLFIAERIESDSALSEIVLQLNEQIRQYQAESETARKFAHRKHAEAEGVKAQANEIAQIDPLTFLPNRRMIVRELQDEVLRSERYHTQFSVSVVDVDHFKKVNDTYGHLAGDEVLRQVGAKIKEQIRHPDIAGRYGGEEFLILLPNSGAHAAEEQAARLCQCLREMVIRLDQQTVQVTISIGIAELKVGTDTWESLLKRADAAMYEAKNRGRDRWEVAE